MKPIVLIHGYSSEGKSNPPEQIYGNLPANLRKEFGADAVYDIDLSRWISLSDGVGLDDISFAMERAINSNTFKSLLDSGFHVVIHSTGALVIRNWVRMFERKPSPIANLVYLAGANFGSGLAHIGQGQLSRWGRLIFQGTSRGLRVLDALEFGSTKTLDLHLHFLQKANDIYDDYQIQEFCANGSQTLGYLRPVPIRYVKEDSADNTVRTSACNLNFNYVTVGPTPEASKIHLSQITKMVDHRLENEKLPVQHYEYDLSHHAAARREIPFAVLYETAHFGDDIGILDGKKNRKQIMPLLKQALSLEHDEAAYQGQVAKWRAVTDKTFSTVTKLKPTLTEWNKQQQYEAHAQLIFRLRDQYGDDVSNHDIMFKSRGRKDKQRLERMIEDKHINSRHRGIMIFYLRVQKFKGRPVTGKWVNLLDDVCTLDFEITGSEPESEDISYLPLTIHLTPTTIRKIIQPFRTTLIDVTLLRLPTNKVFALSKSKN